MRPYAFLRKGIVNVWFAETIRRHFLVSCVHWNLGHLAFDPWLQTDVRKLSPKSIPTVNVLKKLPRNDLVDSFEQILKTKESCWERQPGTVRNPIKLLGGTYAEPYPELGLFGNTVELDPYREPMGPLGGVVRNRKSVANLRNLIGNSWNPIENP